MTDNEKMTRAEAEEIIHLVRSHPEIYDKREKSHRDRNHIAQVWRTISRELGTTAEDVKRKWATLRSNFRREKRKCDTAIGPIKISWPYFESLMFLAEVPQKRTPKETGAPRSPVNDTIVYTYETCNDEDQEEESPVKIRPTPEVVERKRINRKPKEISERRQLSGGSWGRLRSPSISDTEQERPRPPDDTDSMFLRSILPYMKKLDTLQNADFRFEVMQILTAKLRENHAKEARENEIIAAKLRENEILTAKLREHEILTAKLREKEITMEGTVVVTTEAMSMPTVDLSDLHH